MKCEECDYFEPLNNEEHGYCGSTFAEIYPDGECIWEDEE